MGFYDENGNVVSEIDTGAAQPCDVELGCGGRVYVAHGNTHRVAVYDGQGVRVGQWGVYGRDGGGGRLAAPVALGGCGPLLAVLNRSAATVELFE